MQIMVLVAAAVLARLVEMALQLLAVLVEMVWLTPLLAHQHTTLAADRVMFGPVLHQFLLPELRVLAAAVGVILLVMLVVLVEQEFQILVVAAVLMDMAVLAS
jgi:hypothetical protein